MLLTSIDSPAFLRTLKIAELLHCLISKVININDNLASDYYLNMPRIDLTLRNATRIPLLGVKTEPKPYV